MPVNTAKKLCSLICIFAFLTNMLSGCSSTLNPTSSQIVDPTELPLLPPFTGPGNAVIKQKLTITRNGNQQSFLVIVKTRPDQIDLAALLPTGQKILSLNYDGQFLHKNSPAGQKLPDREILALFQLVHWPSDTLKKYYPASGGWIFNFESSEKTLSTASGKWIRITTSQERNTIENYRSNYRIDIEPF